MPSARGHLKLALHSLQSNPGFERLRGESVLERVRKIDTQAREQGLASLDPSSDNLISIGMEINGAGKVDKNGYGVLSLPVQAERNPEWADMVGEEVKQIRAAIRRDHGVRLRYLIWAGMGGSAEDKAFYQAAGLLRKGLRVYILDSTDPAKLRSILGHIEVSEKRPLKEALRKTLVVGMAMGMTSYEPVLNLEVLDALYRKLRIANQSNFIYMTLPDSILDRFGREHGFRRVELQLDNDNTTAGRHSGPLTRGSLYPLALAGCDLAGWIGATKLNEDEKQAALELAGFLQANALEGRDKLTLFLPREWSGGAVWTKQDFEESLGKSEKIGIKGRDWRNDQAGQLFSAQGRRARPLFPSGQRERPSQSRRRQSKPPAPGGLSTGGLAAARGNGPGALHAVHPLHRFWIGLSARHEFRDAAERGTV